MTPNIEPFAQARAVVHCMVDYQTATALAAIREACAKSRMMHSQGLRRMREHAWEQLGEPSPIKGDLSPWPGGVSFVGS